MLDFYYEFIVKLYNDLDSMEQVFYFNEDNFNSFLRARDYEKFLNINLSNDQTKIPLSLRLIFHLTANLINNKGDLLYDKKSTITLFQGIFENYLKFRSLTKKQLRAIVSINKSIISSIQFYKQYENVYQIQPKTEYARIEGTLSYF